MTEEPLDAELDWKQDSPNRDSEDVDWDARQREELDASIEQCVEQLADGVDVTLEATLTEDAVRMGLDNWLGREQGEYPNDVTAGIDLWDYRIADETLEFEFAIMAEAIVDMDDYALAAPRPETNFRVLLRELGDDAAEIATNVERAIRADEELVLSEPPYLSSTNNNLWRVTVVAQIRR